LLSKQYRRGANDTVHPHLFIFFDVTQPLPNSENQIRNTIMVQTVRKTKLIVTIIFCAYAALALTQSAKQIPEAAKELTNPLAGDPSAKVKGYKIYKKVCWSCHGTNGNGLGPGASDLKTKPADLSAEIIKNRTDGELFWWISEGGNGMDAYKATLGDNERWMLVSYVRKIQGK